MRIKLLIIVLLMLSLQPIASHAQSPASQIIPIPGYSSRIAVSPDGCWLAVWDDIPIFQIQDLQPTTQDASVKLVNVETGEVRSLEGSPDNVYGNVAFSPDSAALVGSNLDGYLYHWELESDASATVLTSLPFGGYVDFINENVVVIMLPGNVPQLFTQDLNEGAPTLLMTRHFSFEEYFGDARRNILFGPFTMSPDRNRVTFALQQGDVWVWNLDTLDQDMIVETSVDPEGTVPVGDVEWAVFLDDNAMLYANHAENIVYRVDLDSGQQTVFASQEKVPNGRAVSNGDVIAWLDGDGLNVLSEQGFNTIPLDETQGRPRSIAVSDDKAFVGMSMLDSDGQSSIVVFDLEAIVP